jgi:Uma2 family endonuclease
MWAKQGHHGYVAQEAGYIVRRDPDGVRAADVSYVAKERFLESGIPEKFWSLAPDLAVEVVSPNETADEVQEKVFDYLVAGTPMVWVIYSRTQQVVVHTPDGLARTLRGEDRLEFAQLPGFSCTVAELFG